MRIKDRVVLYLGITSLIGILVLLGLSPNLNLPDFRGSRVSPLVIESKGPAGTFPSGSVVVFKGDRITYRAEGSNVEAVDGGYKLLFYSDSTTGGSTWVSHDEPKIIRSTGFTLEVE